MIPRRTGTSWILAFCICAVVVIVSALGVPSARDSSICPLQRPEGICKADGQGNKIVVSASILDIGAPGSSIRIANHNSPDTIFEVFGETSTPSPTDFGVRIGNSALGQQLQQFLFLSNRNPTKIELTIRHQRQVQIRVNKSIVYGFRWNERLLPDFAKKLDFTVDSRVEAKSTNQILRQYVEFRMSTTLLIAFFVLSLVLAILLGHSLVAEKDDERGQIDLSGYEERRQKWQPSADVVMISGGVTLLSITTAVAGFSGTGRYFTRDGVTLAQAASYSVWIQLLEISKLANPYEGFASNYPPFGLGLFRILGVIQPQLMFVIVVGLSVGLVGGLISRLVQIPNRAAKFAVVGTSCALFYPLLFAIDRGSSELIVLVIFTFFVDALSRGKEKRAAVILGLLVALKAYPIIFCIVFVKSGSFLKRSALVVSTAATCTVFGSLTLSGSPVRAILDYLQSGQGFTSGIDENQNLAARSTSIYSWLYNLKALRIEFGPGDPISAHLRFIALSLSLLLIIRVLGSIVRGAKGYEEAVFLTTLVLLLVIPLSNDYRMLILLPAIVFRTKSGRQMLRTTTWLLGLATASKHFVYLNGSAMTVGSVITMPLILAVLLRELESDTDRGRISTIGQ